MDQTQPNTRFVSDVMKCPGMNHQPGSIGFIEKMIIGQLILISQPKLIIETGTFHGQTTRFLAEFISMNKLGKCRIATFDLPDVINELTKTDSFYIDNPEIELISGLLPESLKEYLNKMQMPIDFAIVDAQHAYNAVLKELNVIHTCLKAGGYIFCHDYRENDPKYEGVVFAVNKFAKKFGYNILPLNNSNLNNEEVVWGTALLRKPMLKRQFSKELFYQLQMVYSIIISSIKKYVH